MPYNRQSVVQDLRKHGKVSSISPNIGKGSVIEIQPTQNNSSGYYLYVLTSRNHQF